MRTDTYKIVIGGALGLLALSSWWLSGRVEPPLAPTAANMRHDPDYIVENFTATTMNELGTRKYVLVAQRLMHYPDDNMSYLTKPILTQFPPTGPLIVTKAETGVMPGDGSEIVMQGNVYVTHAGDSRAPAGGEMTSDRMRIELDN
ncbi:MAG: LPS export ABC transporter periplasmic protein LptC [Gammaproteobacteria bacterium]|nr:LPS export ABC transporter periplasmic protein LptC [Gammaproteobacteria bacterium]